MFYRDFNILEYETAEGKRTQYLIDPDLCVLPELENRVTIKRLIPFVTLNGAYGLWPIAISQDDNKWIVTGLRIAERAKTEWVAVIPRRKAGEYQMLPALAHTRSRSGSGAPWRSGSLSPSRPTIRS